MSGAASAGFVFSAALSTDVKAFLQQAAPLLSGSPAPLTTDTDRLVHLLLRCSQQAGAQMAARNLIAIALSEDPDRNGTALLSLHSRGLKILPELLKLFDSPISYRAFSLVAALALRAPDPVRDVLISSGVLGKVHPTLRQDAAMGGATLRAEESRAHAAKFAFGLASSGAAAHGAALAGDREAMGALAAAATQTPGRQSVAPGSHAALTLKYALSSLSSLVKGGHTQQVLACGGATAAIATISAHGPSTGDALTLLTLLTMSAMGRGAIASVEPGIRAMVDVLGETTEEVILQSALKILGNLCVDDPVAAKLAAVPGLVARIHEIWISGKPDTPLSNQCVKCLANLLVTEKPLCEFHECGGVSTAIAQCAVVKDETVRYLLLSVIANTLCDDDSVESAVEAQVVPLLISFLSNASGGSPALLKEASRGVANITSLFDEPRKLLIDAGAVKALHRLIMPVTGCESDTVINACRALQNLAMCVKRVPQLKEEGLVTTLCQLATRSKDLSIKAAALKVLSNLAVHRQLRPLVARTIGVPPTSVLALVREPDVTVKVASLRLLTNLLHEGRVRKAVNESKEDVDLLRAVAERCPPQFVELRAIAATLLSVLQCPYESKYAPDSPDDADAALEKVMSSWAMCSTEQVEEQRKALEQAKLDAKLLQESSAKDRRKREAQEAAKAKEDAQRAEAQRKEEERKKEQAQDEARRRMKEEADALAQRLAKEKAKEEEVRQAKEMLQKEQEAARRQEEQRVREQEEMAKARREREAKQQAEREQRQREKELEDQRALEAKVREEEAKLKEMEAQKLKQQQEEHVSASAKAAAAEQEHKRRTFIVREIYDTEKNYLAGLSHLINAYLHPLTELCQSRKGGIVSSAEIRTLFSNVEIIATFNSVLLERLGSRLATWSPTTLIGDVFVTVSSFLKTYVEYVNNYPAALESLGRNRRENRRFQAFLDTVEHENPTDPALQSALITPVQRIPRYILLLSDLLKHTAPSHPDYANLEKAVAVVKETGEVLNERKRDAENATKLYEIQGSMKNKCPPVPVPSRKFLAEVACLLIKPSKRKSVQSQVAGATAQHLLQDRKAKHVTLFLFNDVVMIATALGKGKYTWLANVNLQCAIPVGMTTEAAGVSNVVQDCASCFPLVLKNIAPQKDELLEWLFVIPTEEDRSSLIDKISSAQDTLKQRHSTFSVARSSSAQTSPAKPRNTKGP